jgi:hypothetical protein
MADLPEHQALQGVELIDGVNGTRAQIVPSGENAGRLRCEVVSPPGQPIEVSLIEQATTLENKMFGITTNVMNHGISGTEQARILVKNPLTSNTLILFERQILVSIDDGVNMLFRIYHNPTITSDGTVLPIRNARFGSLVTSVASAFTFPTVTSFGTLYAVYQVKDIPFDDELARRIVLDEGNNLLVTLEVTGANKPFAYNAVWIEEPL